MGEFTPSYMYARLHMFFVSQPLDYGVYWLGGVLSFGGFYVVQPVVV